jgi:hypothetical protein
MSRNRRIHVKKLCVALSVGIAGTIFGQIVERDIGDPAVNRWKENQWVSAAGKWEATDERAPDVSPNVRTLRATINYPARTFASWGFAPMEKALPGRTQKITVWTRGVQRFCAAELVVKDAAGTERKFGLPINERQWRFTEIILPADLQQPLTFEGIGFHNWEERNHPEDATVVLDICDLRVFTDVSDVPLAQRAYGIAVEFPALANIFYNNEKPIANFSATSWLGEERTLNVKARVVSSTGDTKDIVVAPLKCAGASLLEMSCRSRNRARTRSKWRLRGFPKRGKCRRATSCVCVRPR